MSLTVHANRDYGKLRAFTPYAQVNASVSGRFAAKDFSELTTNINRFAKDKFVYFIDTTTDTHFEINGKAVSLKLPLDLEKQYEIDGTVVAPKLPVEDDVAINNALTSEQIVEKEQRLRDVYTVGKEVLCIPKKADLKEKPYSAPFLMTVESFSTTKEFIESQANGQYAYRRFALDEHGPLTDAQVDQFLTILSEIQAKGAWLHANSIIGDGTASMLLLMKYMVENKGKDLATIQQDYEPAKKLTEGTTSLTDTDIIARKLARGEFLREFHKFAQERSENQSWGQWKASKV